LDLSQRIRYRKLVFFLIILVMMALRANPNAKGELAEKSLNIRFKICPGQGPECYVGDHFWYDIELQNNGTSIVTGTFTVKVYDANRSVIGERKYQKSIGPKTTTRLFPNYTRDDREEVEVFLFDIAGTYKIEVFSSIPVAFYQYFPNGRYIVQHTICKFYFDAMPSYEEKWRKRMETWMQSNEQWIEENRRMLIEDKQIAAYMYSLTVVMLLVSIVNSILVVWAAPRRGRSDIVVYVWMALLIFILLMMWLRLPISLK